jgi:hypothetical protein
MKRAALFFAIFSLAATGFAGFKVKNLKPKKAEEFQTRSTVAAVTYAADLLLDAKDQNTYFYKELTPSNLIAVRLAIFNRGQEELVLPLDGLQLLDPDGNELALVSPEVVAQAVLQGMTVKAQAKTKQPANVAGSIPDPRRDPANPQYDPRLDPDDPRYDPQDPRNRGQNTPGSYPTGTYPPGSSPTGRFPGSRPSGGTLGIPGIILGTGGGRGGRGGGGGGDLSQIEKQLAEKDFSDKAHTSDPVLSSMTRDRFLYFSIPKPTSATKGYVLRLPAGKGMPQEVVLKF